MVKEMISEAETRMKKSIASLKHHFTTIRTGKATVQMLDDIKVEHYGNLTPLNQVASITAPEPQLLVVQPWEKALVGEIVKAIQKSNLGLNPQFDSQLIRIPVPPLSGDRRKELVKAVRKLSEETKVAVRNIRRDTNEHLKKAEREHKISEDEFKDAEEKVQFMTDRYIKQTDETALEKENEVMEV